MGIGVNVVGLEVGADAERVLGVLEDFFEIEDGVEFFGFADPLVDGLLGGDVVGGVFARVLDG